ncbi:MAG: UDP-N-acetylmuramoyl-L-alanine--D-glutamate ligase [Dermatophilaceae bacterium]
MTARLDGLTHREADWTGLRVLVAGLGVSGFAATDALLERGAQVIAVDAADPGTHAALGERARILDILGADLRFGEAHVTSLPEEELDLVVTSPGWPPHQPLLAAAAARGIPIWGEVELAWRLRPAEGAAPWLCITGTNGKTTTVQMLTSMLRAAGLRAMSVGNVGTPILEAIMDPTPHDVLAVELSSFQLHWSESIRPRASVCLNVAPDHVDWHGSYEEYLRAKGKVYAGTEVACVYNEQDPQTRTLVEDADVQEGCRAIGFTLGLPAPSMIGVVDDVLADRAFVAERRTSAAELATLDDVRGDAPTVAPHQVANALAAAALARAHGIPTAAVRQGLRDFRPEPHRIAEAGSWAGVRYVDDSKATNPHAAAASLAAFEDIVWVAGGLLKGADVDDLVRDHARRLRGVVLIGRDRDQIAQALARHAPDVPVVEVSATDTGAMDQVVTAAAALARAGDVVLLAPAAASMDMFANYGARGDAFVDSVRRLSGAAGE